ncbi:MAG: penicillin acylase family protein [Cyclobacteriaceae bacterium]|nr:penicillin acylase family protein [Cyclobacteriaceae bacterium]
MKKVLKILAAIILILAVSVYFFLQHSKPTYSGELTIEGLKDKVEVKYDTYGIPHIYATNETDAYMALGYVHAQERLFQMEMIRRVATGTLSEILGSDLLDVDKLFRTLGIGEKSKEFAKQFNASSNGYKPAVEAYFKGINSFIKNGATPIEFTIIGITKREFSVEDAYSAAGYMSLGFAEGFKVDPILAQLVAQHGTEYLKDLALTSPSNSTLIYNYAKTDSSKLTSLAQIIEKIPIPLIVGSNSWVIGSNRTKSGKPVFENDTHIGYSQPSVWFEAHLEYPGMSHYGHYLAGVPFSLLGHNKLAAIGLTMFENDDVDFYREKANPDNKNQVWSNNQWVELTERVEVIKIKEEDSDTIIIRTSAHGPIVNDIFFKQYKNKAPVAVWWSYLHFSKDLMDALYQLNHITSLADARKGASMIESPGLNVMYADTIGNIAWWACAKLPIRPQHINAKLVLDGSTGNDDILGYYNFTKNPQAENPPWGYVYSANNQPDSVDGVLYAGYYYPRDRSGRIVELIKAKPSNWTAEDSKQMAANVTSKVQVEIAQVVVQLIEESKVGIPTEVLALLKNWDGDHQVNQAAPSIHNTILAWLYYYTLNDELGNKNLKTISGTSILKTSFFTILKNEHSVWWNDVTTPDKETRNDIIKKTVTSALKTLENNFNSTNPNDWEWGEIHTITHNHPLGKVEALKKYFSVGSIAIKGGNEVINNQMFALDTTGIFPVIAGPAVRTVIDLSNMNGAVSINPTGQSGNFLSKHYDDQAQMFANVEFRPQLMDSLDIVNDTQSVLMLSPTKK